MSAAAAVGRFDSSTDYSGSNPHLCIYMQVNLLGMQSAQCVGSSHRRFNPYHLHKKVSSILTRSSRSGENGDGFDSHFSTGGQKMRLLYVS